MRKAWTDFVRETCRKGNRGKKVMSYREAMTAASKTWPKEKKKILRKRNREAGARPPRKSTTAVEKPKV